MALLAIDLVTQLDTDPDEYGDFEALTGVNVTDGEDGELELVTSRVRVSSLAYGGWLFAAVQQLITGPVFPALLKARGLRLVVDGDGYEFEDLSAEPDEGNEPPAVASRPAPAAPRKPGQLTAEYLSRYGLDSLAALAGPWGSLLNGAAKFAGYDGSQVIEPYVETILGALPESVLTTLDKAVLAKSKLGGADSLTDEADTEEAPDIDLEGMKAAVRKFSGPKGSGRR